MPDQAPPALAGGVRREPAEAAEAEPLASRLRQARWLEPAGGFGRRWLDRLERYRARRRQRQLQIVLAAALLGALLSLGLLGLEALPLFGSPAGLAADWLRAGLAAQGTLQSGVRWLRDLGGGWPAAIGGLLVAATVGWVSALWWAALYRFAFVNRPNGGYE